MHNNCKPFPTTTLFKGQCGALLLTPRSHVRRNVIRRGLGHCLHQRATYVSALCPPLLRVFPPQRTEVPGLCLVSRGSRSRSRSRGRIESESLRCVASASASTSTTASASTELRNAKVKDGGVAHVLRRTDTCRGHMQLCWKTVTAIITKSTRNRHMASTVAHEFLHVQEKPSVRVEPIAS